MTYKIEYFFKVQEDVDKLKEIGEIISNFGGFDIYVKKRNKDDSIYVKIINNETKKEYNVEIGQYFILTQDKEIIIFNSAKEFYANDYEFPNGKLFSELRNEVAAKEKKGNTEKETSKKDFNEKEKYYENKDRNENYYGNRTLNCYVSEEKYKQISGGYVAYLVRKIESSYEGESDASFAKNMSRLKTGDNLHFVVVRYENGKPRFIEKNLQNIYRITEVVKGNNKNGIVEGWILFAFVRMEIKRK